MFSAALPKQPEDNANAGSDGQSLQRLIADVGFKGLLPFLGGLFTLVNVVAGLADVFARLACIFFVLFPGGIADLSAQIAKILTDLLCRFIQIGRALGRGVRGVADA